MMYSYRIEQAIRAASILHRDMVSEGKAQFPYVSHLFSVACIVADYTDNEETIIAGLLHGTIARTDYTLKELAEDFGHAVCTMVKEITPPLPEENARENWKEKHAHYRAQLKNASDEALIVIAADKIHRMRSTIEEYYDDYARFQKDIGDTETESMATCQSISNILNSRLSNDIVHEFNHVFDEYKKFIYDAKKKNG